MNTADSPLHPQTASLLDMASHEDTVAHERDLLRERLDGLAGAAVTKAPTALVEAVVAKLKAFRSEVYGRDDWGSPHIAISGFFPMDRLNEIARNCATVRTVEDLDRVLGPKYNLPGSLLAPYASDILKIIQEATDTPQLDEVLANSLGEQKNVSFVTKKKRGPPGPRKRKYDGVFPEHLLNPDDPKDARFLQRQREMQAYDQRILDESIDRWMERQRQRERAAASVGHRGAKAAANKKSGARGGK